MADISVGYPSIDSNTKGHLALAFPMFFNNVKAIFVKYSPDGGDSWQDVERVSTQSTNCDDPSAAIDEDDNIMVVFTAETSSGIKQMFKTHKLFGKSWSSNERVLPIDVDLGTDIITNGSFSNFSGGIPDNWSVIGVAETAQSSNPAYSGTSMEMIISSEGSNYVEQSLSFSGITKGTRFLISGKIYASFGTGNIEIDIKQGDNVVFTTVEHNLWEEFSTIIDMPDSTIDTGSYIRLYNGTNSDAAYYDEISIRPITSEVYPQHFPNVVGDADIARGHVAISYAKEEAGPGMDLRVSVSNPVGGIDITKDVKSIRISRDKEFKTGKYGAGDFSISLDNKDGVFSVDNESGPLFNRLKSGSEITVELGTRKFTGDSASEIGNDSFWEKEYFPAILGIATEFKLNSRAEILNISGRDKAELLMAYKNFNSEMYQNIQALELIEQLANEDTDNDGVGNIDILRPSVPLQKDAKLQTLTAFNRSWKSQVGSGQGDFGSKYLYSSELGKVDIKSVHTDVNFVAGVWIERGSTDYLWTLTGKYIPTSNQLVSGQFTEDTWPSSITKYYLDKWSGWDSENSTPVNESSTDVTSTLSLGGIFTPGSISISNYDHDHDCVWIQVFRKTTVSESSADDRLQLYKYVFKTNTLTLSYSLHIGDGTTVNPGIDYCGAVIYDYLNSKLTVFNGWKAKALFFNIGDNGESLGSTSAKQWVFDVDVSGNVTLTFDREIAVEVDGTLGNEIIRVTDYLPMNGFKLGEHYYVQQGTTFTGDLGAYNGPTPRSNYSVGAWSQDTFNTNPLISPSILSTIIGNYNYPQAETGVAFVSPTGYPGSTLSNGISSVYKMDSNIKDTLSSNPNGFFNEADVGMQVIAGMDFAGSFSYFFTGDNRDKSHYANKHIDQYITVRRLATLKYQLPHTNIITIDHTIVQGYLEDDDDWSTFQEEVLKIYTPNSQEHSGNVSYDSVSNTWELTNVKSDISSGFPDIPTSDIHINLEDGTLLTALLFDSNKKLTADYDYKHSVPFAWFEDESIWDAIQELATSGDYVCYIDESGTLIFKDRFIYRFPIMSNYEDNLISSGWSGAGVPPIVSAYEIQDNNGTPVTIIIPGLEFVTSYDPDPDTGQFYTYKRRSYRVNGVSYLSTDGDYDINYDTGEIGWHIDSNIPVGDRVLISYYASQYIYSLKYDSNIQNLNLKWGVKNLYNKITVKGERYYPSITAVNERQVIAVTPGDKTINTKFSSLKQLKVNETSNDTDPTRIEQKQFDALEDAWRTQRGKPVLDFEFRNKLVGDTKKSREAGNAIRLKLTPCTAPSTWNDTEGEPDVVQNQNWVGDGYKINWDYPGDTGVINMPTDGKRKINIKDVEVKAGGIKIEVDHLDKDNIIYYIQLEIKAHTLTRVANIYAQHENLASVFEYFSRGLEIDNRFISDIEIAKRMARQKSFLLSEERPEVETTIYGAPFLQLGDIVAVTDVSSGLSGDYCEIISLSHQVVQDNYITELKLQKICEITTGAMSQNAIPGLDGGFIGNTSLSKRTYIDGQLDRISIDELKSD